MTTRLVRLSATLLGLLVAAGCGEKDTGGDSDPQPIDADQDGHPFEDDCDDNDPTRHPGADEACDEVDQDCDGAVDEGVALQVFRDADEDGFGAVDGETAETCSPSEGWALEAGDCDDTDPLINPAADELCDEAGVDEDCDGQANGEDAVDADLWYPDDDLDGYGDDERVVAACEAPEGHLFTGGDCDDTTRSAFPGAREECDGLDNDCDGGVDEEGARGRQDWFLDGDGDGHGDAAVVVNACEAPEGYVEVEGDCDDGDAAVNPDAEEICNNLVDDDCDGGSGACALSGDLELATAWFGRLSGEGNSDFLGAYMHLGQGGDDGDGVADLLLGSSGAGSHGAIYLMEGGSGVVTFDRNASVSNVRIQGEGQHGLGSAVAFAGDHDGDGFDDLVAGAPLDDTGAVNGGAVYLFAGPLTSGVAGDAIATWYSSGAGDGAGTLVAPIGDMNGDGLPDVALTTPGYDGGDGAVVVVMGSTSSASGTSDLADIGQRLTGSTAADLAGSALSGGDHDGDGLDDLAIGANGATGGAVGSGRVLIFAGPLSSGASLASPDIALEGVARNDDAGQSLNWVGDLDGDGYVDLAVGAPGHDGGGNDAGAVYILPGPITGSQSLSAAPTLIQGEAAREAAGSAVAGAGDVNGDGAVDGVRNEDLLIGAPGASGGGRACLFYGSTALVGTLSLANADACFEAETSQDAAGTMVWGVGDFNEDGLDDLLIGSPNWSDGGFSRSGRAYLILGAGF